MFVLVDVEEVISVPPADHRDVKGALETLLARRFVNKVRPLLLLPHPSP